METLFAVLHVVAAVFIVGPMAILPMTAMRAVRSGSASQVATLAKSTTIFTWLSILVVIFGFGVMGMSEWDISITTPWILWSLILWAVAAVLTMTVVVPSMKKAASALESGDSSGARYPAIAAGSGLASILLVIVVILMVWKP